MTRRGHGPGIILLVDNSDALTQIIDGVPSHLVKWAEEGYTVVQMQRQAFADDAANAIQVALGALNSHSKCDPKDKIGVVGKYFVLTALRTSFQ